MLSIRRLTRRFSRQTLSEVKPAPLSETVDHTMDSCKNDDVFITDKPYAGISPCSSVPSSTSSSDSEEEEEEEECSPPRGRGCPKSVVECRDMRIERVPSAEKRKYSQYKCSTGSSSSASSSDDEIKEAFENYTRRQLPPPWIPRDSRNGGLLWADTTLTSRPLKVVPFGCRKKGPKYFAQMSAASFLERPYLDFNKMQHSKRLAVVRRPIVIRHNSRVHSLQRPPTLEVSLDLSRHSFQPVLTQT